MFDLNFQYKYFLAVIYVRLLSRWLLFESNRVSDKFLIFISPIRNFHVNTFKKFGRKITTSIQRKHSANDFQIMLLNNVIHIIWYGVALHPYMYAYVLAIVGDFPTIYNTQHETLMGTHFCLNFHTSYQGGSLPSPNRHRRSPRGAAKNHCRRLSA
jgi:hypothetical protein